MIQPAAGSFRDAAASAQTHIPGAARLMLVIGLLLAAGLGLSPLYVLPSVIPANAPAVEFSGERALADLDVIAADPHPMGSPEHAAVVDFIVAQLEAAGVSPEIQAAPALPKRAGVTATQAIDARQVPRNGRRCLSLRWWRYPTVSATAWATPSSSASSSRRPYSTN